MKRERKGEGEKEGERDGCSVEKKRREGGREDRRVGV